jgi:hypothetical protein
VEKGINGRPDIIVENGNKKAAIEIETGKSNAIDNIQRAIQAGFEEVICVATNRTTEEKLKGLVEKRSIINYKVKVICAMDFDISNKLRY